MGELLPISQSTILLPQIRFHSSTDRTYVHFLNSRSDLRGLYRAICAHRQQNWVSRWTTTTTRVVSDSKPPTRVVESAGDQEIEIQPDTGGGDGLGGAGSAGNGEGRGGGGGGGGGGDHKNNNNEGEGGSGESDIVKKKMAMSMSQKLTLGYAALVGVGGFMGYLKSGSTKSLMAGGLSALLLYYVYSVLPTRPAFASSLGFGLSAALLGIMGSRFKKSGKIFPAGVVFLVSLVMSGGYLHGILRSLH